MKKRILIFAMLILSTVAMVSARCDFDGQMPPHTTNIGSDLTVHYYKYDRSAVISGGVRHEYLVGDVWVIFHNASAARSYRFHTTGGQVQYCYD